MAKKTQQARVLVDTEIDGVQYFCDQVVEADASVLAPYILGGQLDAAAAAVKHAISLGATPVSHKPAVG